MKRWLALAIVAAMALALFAGCGPAAPKASGQIIAGSTTTLSGDWEGQWGANNAADADIRELTTGYSTVRADKEGVYDWDDSVVKSHEVKINEDNTKTFTIEIKKGLKYSDGSEITAKDYVARIALFSSSVIAETDGRNTAGMNYVGWDEFSSGESKTFSGVRLLEDYKFSVTVGEDYKDYYYEVVLASSYPLKLNFWLPEDVELKDDGEGVYFSDNFTLDHCKEKIETARFASEDRPCTGPYKIEKYDASDNTATLIVNPEYQGNHEGQKPRIEKIVYIKVVSETMIDTLKTGGVDILFGLGEGSVITPALDLTEDGSFTAAKYDRAGYGHIQFVCDFGPTQFAAVRHAIAHLLDRDEFARTFTGGFGNVVHGPYGVAMPEYKASKDDLADKLDDYKYSVEKANEILDEDGWVLNAEGGEYVAGGLRYKEVTDEQADGSNKIVTLEDGRKLMPLEIEWLATTNNAVSELINVMLAQTTEAAAGMKITQTVVEWGIFLNYLYRDTTKGDEYGVPTYGMFNLATGFPTTVYDYSYEWTAEENFVAMGYNSNRLFGTELDPLSMDMVYEIEPGDTEAFLEKWVEYVIAWNELLPNLPLYSNIYHDVFNSKLKDYNPTPYFDFTSAILYAYVD